MKSRLTTFSNFLDLKEAAPAPSGTMPPPTGGGISGPGALPPGGGMPPPMGGPLGGMGGPPMGGPMGGSPQGGQTAPNKLKAYNVWDVLERVLGK